MLSFVWTPACESNCSRIDLRLSRFVTPNAAALNCLVLASRDSSHDLTCDRELSRDEACLHSFRRRWWRACGGKIARSIEQPQRANPIRFSFLSLQPSSALIARLHTASCCIATQIAQSLFVDVIRTSTHQRDSQPFSCSLSKYQHVVAIATRRLKQLNSGTQDRHVVCTVPTLNRHSRSTQPLIEKLVSTPRSLIRSSSRIVLL